MTISDPFKEQPYQPVNGHDTDSEAPNLSEFTEPRICQKSHLRLVAPWIASTFSLALITGYLLFQQHINTWSACQAASPSAFRTDLRDAHPYISYEERVFTGKFAFNQETGKVYRDIDPSQPQYFGPPSPEIDDAWADMMRGEFIRLWDEEAAPYTPELNKDPLSDYYHFEPDMFHSLHCLNAVRMELDKDYYSNHSHHHGQVEEDIKKSPIFPDDWDRIHLDHCLDQLRQSIQCQGDFTPAPLYHYNNDVVGLGVGGVHTCRKWEPMREWMDVRKAKDRANVHL